MYTFEYNKEHNLVFGRGRDLISAFVDIKKNITKNGFNDKFYFIIFDNLRPWINRKYIKRCMESLSNRDKRNMRYVSIIYGDFDETKLNVIKFFSGGNASE